MRPAVHNAARKHNILRSGRWRDRAFPRIKRQDTTWALWTNGNAKWLKTKTNFNALKLPLWFHLMTSHHLEFMVYTGWNLMVAEGCYHGWISLSNALIPAISLVCIIQGPAFIRQILTYSSAWIKTSEVYGPLDLFQALKNTWQPYSGQQSHESVSSTVNASFPKVTCWVLIARH